MGGGAVSLQRETCLRAARLGGLVTDTERRTIQPLEVLERLTENHGFLVVIVTDNGPEFTGKALDVWAYKHNVRLDFTGRGKPVENAFIESRNGPTTRRVPQ